MGMEDKDSLVAKVYDLTSHKLTHTQLPIVFYLTQKADCLSTLQSRLPILLIEIDSIDELLNYASLKTPDLIVVDKDFGEATLDLVSDLCELIPSPIILIAPSEKKSSRYIKKAYLHGIHDILFSPVNPEEWREMAKALLKIPETHSLFH